jgi:hypothetical protein
MDTWQYFLGVSGNYQAEGTYNNRRIVETRLISQNPEHELPILFNKCYPIYTLCMLLNIFMISNCSYIKLHSSKLSEILLKIFSFIHCVQTASGAHPVSYPMAYSLGVNLPGREADHSPPSSAEVKNAWSYTSTPPLRLHGVMPIRG